MTRSASSPFEMRSVMAPSVPYSTVTLCPDAFSNCGSSSGSRTRIEAPASNLTSEAVAWMDAMEAAKQAASTITMRITVPPRCQVHVRFGTNWRLWPAHCPVADLARLGLVSTSNAERELIGGGHAVRQHFGGQG